MAPTTHESLRAGRISVVRTPRRAQSTIAASRGGSGTKYGFEITTSRSAQYIRLTNTSDIAPLGEIGPVPNATAGKPADTGSGVAVVINADRSSPVSSIQSLANSNWFCNATGPSNLSMMSTQGAYFALMRNSGSAQFWLPHQVTRLSTTTILRWFRRSTRLPRTSSSPCEIFMDVHSRTPAPRIDFQC